MEENDRAVRLPREWDREIEKKIYEQAHRLGSLKQSISVMVGDGVEIYIRLLKTERGLEWTYQPVICMEPVTHSDANGNRTEYLDLSIRCPDSTLRSLLIHLDDWSVWKLDGPAKTFVIMQNHGKL